MWGVLQHCLSVDRSLMARVAKSGGKYKIQEIKCITKVTFTQFYVCAHVCVKIHLGSSLVGQQATDVTTVALVQLCCRFDSCHATGVTKEIHLFREFQLWCSGNESDWET